MRDQKKQTVNKNQNRLANKPESQRKAERIMDIYESVPNFVDKSTKNLLIKYSL